MTYTPYYYNPWKKLVLARRRALVHKLLNYRMGRYCNCKLAS